MRSELIEMQKADLGRKYARVDRRPLDPPPVVLLKLYSVIDSGTDHEAEQEVSNYEEVQNVGLVCTVDLFPVPGPSGSSTPSLHSNTGSDGRFGSESLPVPPASVMSAFAGETDPSGSLISFNPFLFGGIPAVVHHINNIPVLEGSKATTALVGQMVVQQNLVEYQGRKELVFVFADMAVKIEGNFILRYRVFDLCASNPHTAGESCFKMQAECYGGPFRVYSTKDFPGLQAFKLSTDRIYLLIIASCALGVRLNIRETERRKRRRIIDNQSPPYTMQAMKRKWPDGEDEQYDEDGGYSSAGD
ncbi:hypothetical protein NMY22_g17283 [Coprinellus aureogranulatus]|nr:hypothetical protein NMY22_g17283 [Coprinellus aureogranulatus]